jgi:hypothetical protein
VSKRNRSVPPPWADEAEDALRLRQAARQRPAGFFASCRLRALVVACAVATVVLTWFAETVSSKGL